MGVFGALSRAFSNAFDAVKHIAKPAVYLGAGLLAAGLVGLYYPAILPAMNLAAGIGFIGMTAYATYMASEKGLGSAIAAIPVSYYSSMLVAGLTATLGALALAVPAYALSLL